MCLVYLFKQLHEQNISPALDLTAFIIDHQARHESTTEACEVARLLHRIGNLPEETSFLKFYLIPCNRNKT